MDYPRNKVIAKMREGKLATCTKINITDYIPAEIAAMCGFDCVWLDMEHVPSDYQEVNMAIMGAKLYGAEVIVRTPRGPYSNLTRPLELDASGVMVPHCLGLKDAKEIAYYTKFHPIGRRPIDGGNADGRYCLLDVPDYLKYSNEEKLTIIQIEDVETMDEIEEIAQVPGIDMLFFGPGDFSHSIGLAADTGNPTTCAAREKVTEVANRYGKFAGTVGGPGNVKDLYDMGYRFVSMGADVVALSEYNAEIIRKTKELGLI